ncbi:unnamed protein product [Meganyctiphanes norvegica]|uniref:Uncharacterized protein n=1 Tax=Meganyctiphanes norvegica TaxID=48144 RepID=A0AAV2RDN4_MEGNR
MLIDGLENHAPVIMQASLDNITLPNTENIDLLFSDDIKYQQYQNHIKDKKKEKNIFDNSAETFIGDTNKYDKSKIIKTDTKFQNQKVNPKFKYPKKVGEKKANHKSEEESDLFVMIDDENNINPIEEKIENTKSIYKNISELKSYKYHKSENEKDPTPDEKEENENSILENQDLEKLED